MKKVIGLAIAVVLVTLLAIGWFYMKQTGAFIDKDPGKVNLCRNITGDVVISWKDPSYRINRFSANRNESDIVQVSIGLVKNNNHSDSHTLTIDSLKDRYIELNGTIYTIKEIPMCQ